ncbi:MAG: RNA pyrophosphohydrolase [Gammaproteobacteria bacterium]|nr:MAG: RNA pyrophosphohydrolase [Gammaproteobacteria bacterium]RTZ60113.1 MAG: RNA pyrophosphohydrolase [Gammaproteobacteria bacterium]
MLDENGYRPNVGIIVTNTNKEVLWARRSGHDGWQFPQGGVKSNESTEQALFRELYEEIGLKKNHVEIVGRTRDWLHYDLPGRYQRSNSRGFRGQKQIWFLLRLICSDSKVNLRRCSRPEFDAWRWTHYWRPLKEIVSFKRDVYRSALTELEPLLFDEVRAKTG